jgi:hypothetical protein
MVTAIIIFASTAAAVAFFLYFNAELVIRRRLRKAPQHTTASFQDGTVGVVQGTLHYLGYNPLVAPLTGRPCAYYEAFVTLKSGDAVTEVARERQGQDFLLQDDDGVARVSMQNYKVYVVKDAHFHSDKLHAATPQLEAFLAKHGVSSCDIEGYTLHYGEGILEAGETVAVCGYGTREVDPDPRAATGGYRDHALRLVLSPRSDFPLYISDNIDALRRAPKATLPSDPTTR